MTQQPLTSTIRSSWAGPSARLWMLPVLVGTVLLTVTAVAYKATSDDAVRNEEARLFRLSERVLTQLKARVDSANEAVHGARAHLLTTGQVTHDSWTTYAAHVLPSVGPGIVGIGYVERIRRDQIPALEARLHQEGAKNFTVERLGTRDWVYAVTRIEPENQNVGVLGLDIGSGNTRRLAAEEAMRTGEAVLSRRIRIVEGQGEVPGFLLLLPVYRPGQPVDTPDARTAALTGWAYAPLRVDSLTKDLLGSSADQIEYSLSEDRPSGPPAPLFASGALTVGPGQVRRAHLMLYGRSWTADFKLRRNAEGYGARALAPAILVAGLLVSLLSTGLCLAFVSTRQRAERLAAQMTEHLVAANERLDLAAANAEQLAAKATHANQAKTEFLAMMSHEIRTPLNGVMGMTGLLLDSRLNLPQRELAETIRACGDVLMVLLNDVLDLSKIEAGQLTLDRVAFNLQDVVDQAFDVVAPKAASQQLDLLVEIDPETPTHLLGDPARLRQVLLNLLSNAVKFTERGQVSLRIGATGVTPDGSTQLRFAVRDSGIGIAADAIGQLFQPFSQVDSSISRRFGGTGLGLAISRRIVKQMGGNMWVESVPSQGSTFHFTVQLPTDPARHASAGDSAVTLAARRVLVVDDNSAERDQLASLLLRWGTDVTTSPSLSEARAQFDATAAFDAIIIRARGNADREDARSLTTTADGTTHPTSLIWISSSVLLDDDGQLSLRQPVRPRRLRAILERALLVPDASTSAASDATDATPRSDPANASAETTAVAKLERILVAEDNAINQRLAELMLKTLGYQTDVVSDGRAALEAIRRTRYALVLLDVHMPELDGLEVAQAVQARADDDRPWIVGLTANAMPEERERGLAAGMDDFVTKPLTRPALVAALERGAVGLAARRATRSPKSGRSDAAVA